jgi:hypothetical protein
MARQTGQLVRQLRKQGCEVVTGGKGHWKVIKDGRLVTTIAATPGGHGHTFANAVSALRKAGIRI